MSKAMSLDEDGKLTAGKRSGKTLTYLFEHDKGYVFYLWLYGFGCSRIQSILKSKKSEFIEEGRDIFTIEREALLKETLNKNGELSKDIKKKEQTIDYLEGFIDFCKCGNPKADCICPGV